MQSHNARIDKSWAADSVRSKQALPGWILFDKNRKSAVTFCILTTTNNTQGTSLPTIPGRFKTGMELWGWQPMVVKSKRQVEVMSPSITTRPRQPDERKKEANKAGGSRDRSTGSTGRTYTSPEQYVSFSSIDPGLSWLILLYESEDSAGGACF